MIGIGPAIPNVEEFNRRARIALNAATFSNYTDSSRLGWMRTVMNAGFPFSKDEQQEIFNLVHKYRRQITDQAVKDYAADRAKGAD